jgi:hypothetical protein
MDEIEFMRAYNNLRVLVDHAREMDHSMHNTHICNALLTIAAMLDALNQRTIEMQAEEDDE